MQDLSSVIHDAFVYSSSRILYTKRHHQSLHPANMIIPIYSKVFEIPVMADSKLYDIVRDDLSVENLSLFLNYEGRGSRYKSLDGEFREILSTDFASNRLAKIDVPKESVNYYASRGAIFNSELYPVMLLSWQVKGTLTLIGMEYTYLRPILRIHSSVFIQKSDSVQRYIINKILPACLCTQIIRYPYIKKDRDYTVRDQLYDIKVEIDNCPFLVQKVDTPSISTTNEDIIKAALDNSEDFLV